MPIKHWFLLVYILLILAIFIIDSIFALPKFFLYVPLILAFVPIFIEAVKQLKNKIIGTEFFIIFASIIGLMGGEVKAITTVLIIMLIAEFLNHLIEEKTESAIESLVNFIPEKVTLLKKNKEEQLEISKVKPGDLLIVKTGEYIPIDGFVVYGTAQINESSLTGESTLKEKSLKAQVFAGTFIENGSLIIEAIKVGEDTFFSKIKLLVEKAEKTKARIVNFTSKLATALVPLMLFFILTVWFLYRDLKLIITLLVFGSPLELTLIAPLTILAAKVAAFKQGILIKGGIYIEQLAKIDSLIFDKTGTLTSGQPEIIEIIHLNKKYNERDIIFYAAIAEKLSSHVLAKAILQKAQQFSLTIPSPDNFKNLVGQGVEISYENTKYFLGTKVFLEQSDYANIKFLDLACKVNSVPHTKFYLAKRDKLGSEILGKICVTDKIRNEAKIVIERLKLEGIKNFYILSGDNQQVVNSAAKYLKIENAYGDMLPPQKVELIKKLQYKGQILAMVGDGINDAPSIKQANVGIAMGAMGMEPAIAAADIILMTNDLNHLLFVYKLSKKVMITIKQNVIFGFILVHALGMGLAFLKILNPIKAAIFHAFEDFAILVNSTRLINYKNE